MTLTAPGFSVSSLLVILPDMLDSYDASKLAHAWAREAGICENARSRLLLSVGGLFRNAKSLEKNEVFAFIQMHHPRHLKDPSK